MTVPKHDIYSTYGGELIDRAPTKNFHNPLATDLPADDFSACRASIAGMTQLDFQCYMKLDTDHVSLIEYETVWDKGKSALPTFNVFSGGILFITFPPTVVDLQGKKHILNFMGGLANPDLVNSATGYQATINKQGNNKLVLYCRNFSTLTFNALPVDIFIF